MIVREMPYTNLHDLNIDWILKIVKDFQDRYQNLDETFQNMLQQIITAGNNAVEAINNNEETALEAIRVFMEQCVQALDTETTNHISEIQNVTNNQLDAINAAGTNQIGLIDQDGAAKLSAISSAGTAQVNIINGLITTLPQTYEDAVNQLQIINAVLNQTYNYPPLVQGHYADQNESDSKTLVADNYRVSTLLSSGCASRKIKIQVTNAAGIIRDIIYWTGWGDQAVSHQVSVSTSASDEKTIYEYTFPATATYFTIVFAYDYNMGTQLLVADIQVSLQWLFNALDSIELHEYGFDSGNTNALEFVIPGNTNLTIEEGSEIDEIDVSGGSKIVATSHKLKDSTARESIDELNSEFDNVTEPTRNLWLWGDQFVAANGSNTQKGITDVNIPAGTYTLSALVERTGSANCRMVFYKDSIATSNLLANPYIAANSRNSATFTLSDAATIIVIYSGPNATSNVDSTWKDIQLEIGDTATDYIYPICCVDPVARAEAEDGLSSLVTLNELIRDAIGTDETFEQQTISAGTGYGSGKYWNSENTTAAIASSANYYAYNPFAVSPGEKYKLEITQGSSSKQYPVVVVNSDYTILSAYRGTTIGPKTFIFTIPENGAYILITTTTAAYSGTKLYKAVQSLSQKLSEITGGMFGWNGKNVAIIGDSISTNGNYDPSTNPYGNVPEIIIQEEDVNKTLSAYVTAFDVYTDTSYSTPTGLTIGGHTFTDSEIGTEVTFTPELEDVGKMVGKPLSYNPASTKVWWEVAQEKMGFTPIAVCWSGASLSSHEGDKKLYKTSYGWHPATIRKCGIRQPGSMNRTAPDVIIVYRGTNDFSHEPYVKLALPGTEINGYPGNYPASDAVNNNGWSYGLVDAMMVLVKKLRTAYPQSVIVFATLNVFKRVNYSEYPTNNGVNTLPQYNDTIRKTAESLGCYVIDFEKDGITFENCYSGGYITDSSTTPTHPNDKGHSVMGKRAMLDLAKMNEME